MNIFHIYLLTHTIEGYSALSALWINVSLGVNYLCLLYEVSAHELESYPKILKPMRIASTLSFIGAIIFHFLEGLVLKTTEGIC